MNLTEIKQRLADNGLRPLVRFGQNFLHDRNIIEAIVADALAGLGDDDPILEIGPGLGALTGAVLERGRALTSIEIDRGLAAILRERFGANPQFTLLEGDALEILADPNAGKAIEPRLVLGNLPYYISTPLLAKALALPVPPRRLVVMLQKEVARRLAASVGSDDYGGLSIVIQSQYAVTLTRTLPPTVFYPQPEVDSAVVRLDLLEAPPVAAEGREAFAAFVKKGFAQRRKKLSNTLGKLGVSDDRRPEALSVAEWVALWESVGKPRP